MVGIEVEGWATGRDEDEDWWEEEVSWLGMSERSRTDGLMVLRNGPSNSSDRELEDEDGRGGYGNWT